MPLQESGTVRIGQVWVNKARMPPTRYLRVLSVHPPVIHSPAYARLVDVETGRETGIQLRRLTSQFWLRQEDGNA